MRYLAVSRVGHSQPTHVFEWFALCGGLFVLFVLLVAGAAHMANLRDIRRYGRADPHTYPEDPSLVGRSDRPWEEMYRRRGIDAAKELADANAAHDERIAEVVAREGAINPIGPAGSNPKAATDAAPEVEPR